MRVAVVGATGAVGSTMLGVMRERDFPANEIVPFASERSAGRMIDYGDTDLTVVALSQEAIEGFDLALFSAGSATSKDWAPRFAEAGAVVVDNSSQWRMHEDVPLVVAEVNPDALHDHRGIVANPNCTTMQTVIALKPILDAAGIERLVMSTYQAVSGTGQRAVDELYRQAEAVIEAHELPAPAVYPHQIAFNVLPQVETFKALGDAGVNIEMISTSPIKISCVVREEHVETAVRELHTAFELGADAVRREDVTGDHRPVVREEAAS